MLLILKAVYTETHCNLSPDAEEITPESEEAKTLELEGVRAAESGNVESALASFSRAIEIAPRRASSYNNRAQALRLQGKIDGKHTEQRCNK